MEVAELWRKRVDPEKAKSLDLAKAKLDSWTNTLENGDATSSLVNSRQMAHGSGSLFRS